MGIFWGNKQIEPHYTTMTLFLTDTETGIVYRYEKSWLGLVSEVIMMQTAQDQIDELKTELSAKTEIEGPIVYEEGLAWQ